MRLLLLPRILALYSVSFFHNSKNCSAPARAMSVYGNSIPGDFGDKCRYAETLKDDGSLKFHLAFRLTCGPLHTVELVDYKPSPKCSMNGT